MALNINNEAVVERIDSCFEEFERINFIIKGMGSMSHPVPFLTRYSIIKACGTIEFSFKTILSDVGIGSQTKQLKQFIDKKIRYSSMNPSYGNMCSTLNNFDEEWRKNFKKSIKDHPEKEKILDSLDSLNSARNAFAHGGTPSTSFVNVQEYFVDSIKVLEALESSIVEDFE